MILYTLHHMIFFKNLGFRNDSSYDFLKIDALFTWQDELLEMMGREGFVFNNYVKFALGIVSVHSGFKI